MSLKDQGYCTYVVKIDKSWVDKLKVACTRVIERHPNTSGMSLNSLAEDDLFIDFLDELFEIQLIEFIGKQFFESKFILNSFSSLNNNTGKRNFSSEVHRDIRFYSGEIPVMLNAILMLDDFTEENGPTLILPESHKKKYKPSDGYFQERAIKVLGKSGTIFLFDSNVWHCSSPNNSGLDRLAIAMTFSKSCIKQLLDYPQAISKEKSSSLSAPVRQLLGFDAIVPKSIDEWYGERTYKKDQD
jgi:ectoine hydroxylase-related dioxygenase (phytanoyl-CoA dioxygenase family)